MSMTMDVGALLRVAFALRLATAALTLLTWRRPAGSRILAFAGSSAASLLTLAAAATVLHGGAPATGQLLMHAASGFAFTFTLDGLSAWFLVVLATLAIPVAAYSPGYLAHGHWAPRAPFVGAVFNVLLGVGRTRLRRRRRPDVPLRLGNDDAGHRGARRDRARTRTTPAARPTSTW